MMKDNQKKYLDKVVDILVRETIIDQEEIEFPFLSFFPVSFYVFSLLLRKQSTSQLPNRFSKYSKVTYGLGGDEIEYVWDNYSNIIKDKIDNER